MRLTHLVASSGCASKLGPVQLRSILDKLPRSTNPNVLVGFESSDDAGVFLLPSGEALVQTMDFFTPIVDDPYAYGQIAAANALSDVYAMGGSPVTCMNIACFDPASAPEEVWAEILRGMYDKTVEAGAVCVGGHSVIDGSPKFGMSVTGLVRPDSVWSNDKALPGDGLYLTKSLGTGIVTTAAKFDDASSEELAEAIESMCRLNESARDSAKVAGNVQCVTDITGFGLAGHLSHIARASLVAIEVDSAALPVLSGVKRMIANGHTTGGAVRNKEFVGPILRFDESVPDWMRQLVFDPQTSGGLAICSQNAVQGAVRIGSIVEGKPGILIK